MNTRIKGAVAAAAAAVLCLGGLGTLAYWNDDESTNGGTVSSGELSLEPPTNVSWFDVTGGGEEAIADIEAFLIVPGDEIEYRASVVVNAAGDNLAAELNADGSTISGDASLLENLDTSLVAFIGVAPGTPVTGDYPITAANDGDTVNVVVTLSFDSVSTTDLEAQNESVDLADLTVTLQQVQEV
ncbi:alternate-type signal peptide domain-containing protein [Williamsia muralis]|uniref:alternate-type signal peptide domain-containing protein n=1 Tax=Williamsia marianensis TaxID=85044 RepID=UPI00382CA60D